MRQIMIVAAAALAAAILACAGAIAFIKLSPEEHDAGRVAQTQASTPSARQQAPAPRPTVTVTEPTVVPEPAEPPQRPDFGDADANFLALIAADGITAPDGWAIEAGQTTCGEDYASAHEYLTDGGLYDHHVQTFLDDWMITHGGC